MNEYGEVYNNVNLEKYNTYGIKSYAKYLIKPYDIECLKKLIIYLNNNFIKYIVFGNGSNIIIPDTDFDGAIIKLDKFNDIKYNDDIVQVSSGVKLNILVEDTLNHGYGNLFFLSGIPGTVGGALVQNAGAFNHAIFDYVNDVTVLYDGKVKIIDKKDIDYSYRYTEFKNNKDLIILSCTIKLEKGNIDGVREQIKENLNKRISTQPLKYKNAGSVFKNPENDSAGRIIDELGLKGLTVGGAKVSDEHANFIINYNFCKSSDIIELINIIKKKVKEEKNIDLELEQEIINW